MRLERDYYLKLSFSGLSTQSNSHSTYRTSSPQSRLVVIFSNPPTHMDPPHLPTYLLCLNQKRMAAYFEEDTDGERPAHFVNTGMLDILVSPILWRVRKNVL